MPNNPKDVRAGAGPRAGSENGGVSLGVDRPAPLSGNDNGAPSASMPKESLEGTKKIGTFHALGIRNFRLLWISTLFSSTGMWIQMATMGWLVYDLTGSGTLLGAMNGVRAIPMLFLAPLAGVVADRMNRRTVLMGVQLVILVTTLGLAIGLALDQVTLW
ncbi:MAG: MFS transporter, partial [Chloroflexi bacterium]|nr:MFS transporter [Chloroflexota bacterium]